jgi:hypothetical protein
MGYPYPWFRHAANKHADVLDKGAVQSVHDGAEMGVSWQMKSGTKSTALPLWLAAAGVVAIVTVNMVLAAVLSDNMTAKLLMREGIVKQEFLNSILSAEGSAGTLFNGQSPNPALNSFATHVKSLPGIVRANIYSPDGFIRHSTEAGLVGVHFADNDELAEAFKGKITSVLETVDESDKSEHLALNQGTGQQLIEAYIPVKAPDGSVAAVVEFYRRDNWVRDMVVSAERSIWVAGGLSSLILVVVLYLALRSRRSS